MSDHHIEDSRQQVYTLWLHSYVTWPTQCISETEPAQDLTLNSDWLANQFEILMYKNLVLIAMHCPQRSVRLLQHLIYALLLSVYCTRAEHKNKHIDYRCTNLFYVALPNQSWIEIISAFSLQLCSRQFFLKAQALIPLALWKVRCTVWNRYHIDGPAQLPDQVLKLWWSMTKSAETGLGSYSEAQKLIQTETPGFWSWIWWLWKQD